MYAIFVRIKRRPVGKVVQVSHWRLEAFVETERVLQRVKTAVEEENGPGSFFSVALPE